MARRLSLKNIPFDGVQMNGAEVPQLAFGPYMLGMLRNSVPGRGLAYDEVVRACEAIVPIQKAVDGKDEDVTLTDEQWRTLCSKLETWQFTFADPAFVELGRMIKEAEEIGTGKD